MAKNVAHPRKPDIIVLSSEQSGMGYDRIKRLQQDQYLPELAMLLNDSVNPLDLLVHRLG